ncbi:MAG: ferritin [Anaerolineales bacterium]|nr:ferritin [Chloroflexota bacterium]MBL6980627.1 ferritin [Anaerolineales bacterium]
MIISKELENAINAQVGAEFAASLQYVSIAAYFDADDLPQLAAFFYRQAEEEKEHAMKFALFVVEAGGEVRIPAIEKTFYEFTGPEHCAQLALDWETDVTKMINNLMDIAVNDKDYISQDFLRWFVAEQLEEISTMGTLVKTIQRAGDNILLAEDFLARNPIVEEGHGSEE